MVWNTSWLETAPAIEIGNATALAHQLPQDVIVPFILADI